MNLIFWQNILSPHQAPFMRGLATFGHQVTVVSHEAMSADRHDTGWEVPSLGAAKVVLNPSQADVSRIVKAHGRETIHIIAGARGTDLGKQVAHACFSARSVVGIISEAPDPRGLPGFLRWIKYTFERFTIGRSFAFILAMGQTGSQWFKRCGYPPSRVFPFAYVPEFHPSAHDELHSDRYEMLYVGRLVRLKGVDILLRALEFAPQVHLTVVGDGPEKLRLQELARDLQIGRRINWMGALRVNDAQAKMLAADMVVLPSRKDGWGAVVNEALMAGTPVICSSACGASELLQHAWLGTVFRSESVKSLTREINRWSAYGKHSEDARRKVRIWSDCIRETQISSYLEKILMHVSSTEPCPVAPWKLDLQHQFSAR